MKNKKIILNVIKTIIIIFIFCYCVISCDYITRTECKKKNNCNIVLQP